MYPKIPGRLKCPGVFSILWCLNGCHFESTPKVSVVFDDSTGYWICGYIKNSIRPSIQS